MLTLTIARVGLVADDINRSIFYIIVAIVAIDRPQSPRAILRVGLVNRDDVSALFFGENGAKTQSATHVGAAAMRQRKFECLMNRGTLLTSSQLRFATSGMKIALNRVRHLPPDGKKVRPIHLSGAFAPKLSATGTRL